MGLVSLPWSSGGTSWEYPGPKLGEVKESVSWCLLLSLFWNFLSVSPVYPMEDGSGRRQWYDCRIWSQMVYFPKLLKQILE